MTAPVVSREDEAITVEPRWPFVLGIGLFIAITIVLHVAVPHHVTLGPAWLIPSVEVAGLVLLLAADPARTVPRHRRLRRAPLMLAAILAVAVFATTAKLISELIQGGKVTNSATTLLASGALIWMGNILVFGLLYWLLDGGGPVARSRDVRPYADFAFQQQQDPALAPPDWRPQYVDYLALGFTTSTAFSPTDVMPLRARAKLLMASQSLIALVLAALVISRAVNVFR